MLRTDCWCKLHTDEDLRPVRNKGDSVIYRLRRLVHCCLQLVFRQTERLSRWILNPAVTYVVQHFSEGRTKNCYLTLGFRDTPKTFLTAPCPVICISARHDSWLPPPGHLFLGELHLNTTMTYFKASEDHAR